MTETTRKRRTPEQTWADFQAGVQKLGGEVLEPKYLGSKRPHRCRCVLGHDCTPSPDTVKAGQGICRKCVGSVQAEQKFRNMIAERGGEVLEPEWLGTKAKHHVRCVNGHDCYPQAGNVIAGWGFCNACLRRSPLNCEQRFRDRIAELGGEVLEEKWLGSQRAHRVRCKNGHDCAPSPSNVLMGRGICKDCNNDWYTFYIAVSEDVVKFGVTGSNPWSRLRAHSNRGFNRILSAWTNLPEGVARATEVEVLCRLESLGASPVEGDEYFPVDLSDTILRWSEELLT